MSNIGCVFIAVNQIHLVGKVRKFPNVTTDLVRSYFIVINTSLFSVKQDLHQSWLIQSFHTMLTFVCILSNWLVSVHVLNVLWPLGLVAIMKATELIALLLLSAFPSLFALVAFVFIISPSCISIYQTKKKKFLFM